MAKTTTAIDLGALQALRAETKAAQDRAERAFVKARDALTTARTAFAEADRALRDATATVLGDLPNG